eukprot:CAMPEP_0117465416 /NCGR_PEP_ID=MMETSP0784-20121206/4616_1 /TAXON_ID=39447 /ORGANISM="" /LENGTH=141 /DNA_ID=CAMNT_0005259327 /DNA_START=57 /DNA_END=482 /DNA_ORIENTATION=-
MVDLDEICLLRVLSFVNDPVARLCCRAWAAYIHTALQLEYRIRFHKAMQGQGALSYHHSTVWDLGGTEECVSYSFSFWPQKRYSLQWFREGLTSDNEQQYGEWEVVADVVKCKTLEPPEAPDERYLRFAAPGRLLEVGRRA